MGYLTKIYKVKLKCETCHISGWKKGGINCKRIHMLEEYYGVVSPMGL
jgi:hypothetical protein